MKFLAILGLVLVATVAAEDVIECLRQTPVQEEQTCAPPLNSLILQRLSVVRCCKNQGLYPYIPTLDRFPNTNILRCQCVTNEVLCAAQPERCNLGVPKQRYIRY